MENLFSVEGIRNINSYINNIVWGPIMLVFIVGVGIFFTFATKWFQVTKIRMWLKNTLGLLFKKQKAEAGSVTPFQAFTTAMAATAGTGNLVGVATALILGGPGAVFWMWVSGFFGMMTKYAEIVLAIHFRKRNEKGDWVGGPMYYINEGIGKKFKGFAKVLSISFAIFGSLCAFGIGNMTQINSIAGTTEAMLIDLNMVETIESAVNYKLVMGIVLAILVGLVIMGGIQRIGNATEMLVPFIGILNVLGCVVAIAINAENIAPAISAIFGSAFNMKAVGSGALGYTMMQAMRFGVARGVFTNEAGLGSAPIAHAAADTDHPVKQGMWGVFEVFADTLIMCTLSAFVILTSGLFLGTADTSTLDAAQLISAAFKSSFGIAGSIFMAFSVLIFAYCTTLSWSLYGQRCFEYLFKGKGVKIYQIIFCCCVVVAAIMKLELAWDIADTLNGLMAIPNLIALMLLSGLVIRLTKEYLITEKRKK